MDPTCHYGDGDQLLSHGVGRSWGMSLHRRRTISPASLIQSMGTERKYCASQLDPYRDLRVVN